VGKVYDNDLLLAGSHNEDTVRLLMNELPQRQNSENVNFGQLCGLGDHLSYMLIKKNFSVFKLAPWGEDNIVFPFLLRRAEESKQMIGAVHLQSKLINDELMKRARLR